MTGRPAFPTVCYTPARMYWPVPRLMVAAVLAACCALLPSVGQGAERVALVVGCGTYGKASPFVPLGTATQDAKALGALLISPALGFEVVSAVNPSSQEFYAKLREFKKKAQG